MDPSLVSLYVMALEVLTIVNIVFTYIVPLEAVVATYFASVPNRLLPAVHSATSHPEFGAFNTSCLLLPELLADATCTHLAPVRELPNIDSPNESIFHVIRINNHALHD